VKGGTGANGLWFSSLWVSILLLHNGLFGVRSDVGYGVLRQTHTLIEISPFSYTKARCLAALGK
jgi:hypothetical protein